MKSSTKVLVSALMSAGLVTLAACGKQEEPKPAATPAAPAEPTVTVKIASIAPLTKKSPHLGKDNENGVAYALAEANAAKIKVDGKVVKFEMMSEDDEGDPKVGSSVSQKVVDSKVAAVIGHLNSGVTIPSSVITSKAGIPMVSGSATATEVTSRGLKGVFRTVANDDQQGAALGAYLANEVKAKKVALIDDKTAYGEGLRKVVEEKLKAGKVAIVDKHATTDSDTDFKAILTKIKAKNPDVIFHGGMDQTAGPMVRQARELGIKAVFAFGDGACTDKLVELAGAANAEGIVCSQAGLPREAASPEFIKGFSAKFGEIKQYAPYTYDATRAVIEAMKKANSVDPAKFGPEIYNVSFTGASGKVEFDEKGDRKDAEITLFKVKDGKVTAEAVIKGGVSTKFNLPQAAAPAAAPAPAAAAPAAAPAKDAKPAEAPKK